MDQILSQLGELIVGSVPTMVLFLLLVTAYGFLVRRPLDRILAERRARTSGAMEQAGGAIKAAEAKTAEYEDKLRAARATITQGREARLKALSAERDAVLAEARDVSTKRVLAAKLQIEASAASARQQIETATDALTAQILKAVLPAGSQEVTQ